MTVMEAIQERHSVRHYAAKPVEEEKLQKVLEAGRLAPSANNEQAWKFVVVTDPELREKMVEACHNYAFVGEAPVILAVCSDHIRSMRCGQPARTVDCSIALSFMMLEATELGLGSCWIGAFEEDKVRSLLNVPPEFQIVAVTPLGYPEGKVDSHPRRPLGEIVLRESF